MDMLHAILVALLQGATELFPVSSLGHAVIVPALFNWNVNQHSPSFLPFLVLLHAGTAAALFAFFWKDWWKMARGVSGLEGAERKRESRHLLVLIVIATIPAVLMGFVLNKFLKQVFDSALVTALFLAFNGYILLKAEKLKQGLDRTRTLETMNKIDALIIGFCQCGALFPGISRSGTTIVGGLLRGLSHEAAAHFSFLIALPIIIGATVLEVPKLLKAGMEPGVLQLAFMSAAIAGVTAYVSTWLLMKIFHNNDQWSLRPFGYYCIIFGAISFIWLPAGQ